MDPIPLSNISESIKRHYGTAGAICPESQKFIEQSTKFDRRETKSALQLVTFHDFAGRMVHESYVPKDFDDQQAIEFTARLLSPRNPLKEKIKSCSVKRQ